MRAERYRNLGNATKALESYSEFIERDDRYRRALIGKAWALERLDRDEDAHRAINQASMLKRDDPETLSLRALLHEKEGDYFGAELVISPLLNTWDKHPIILHRQASIALGIGQPDAALPRIWRALRISNSNAEIVALFAETVFRRGECERAYRCAESALKHSKGVRGPRVLLAHEALEAGENERAREFAIGEIAIDPGNPVAWTQRALAAAELARYEEAWVARARARELSEGSVADDIVLPWEAEGYYRSEFGEIGQLESDLEPDASCHVEPALEVPQSEEWTRLRALELEGLRLPASDRRSREILSVAHRLAECEQWHTVCLYARFVLDRGHFKFEATTLLARSLDALNRYDEGLEAWISLCRHYPRHEEAWRQVLRRETNAKLLADLAEGAELAGADLPEVKAVRLRAEFEEWRLTECIEDARELASAGLRDPWVDLILGCDFAENGEWTLAMPRLKRAVRAGRREALPLFLLGSHHEEQGEVKEARLYYDKLVDVAPKFVQERYECHIPLNEYLPIYNQYVGPVYAEALLYAGHTGDGHSILEDWCAANTDDTDAWEQLADLRESNEWLVPKGVQKDPQEIREYVSLLRTDKQSDAA